MDYVSLGNTGLKVSRLCLGMMTYGSTTWRDWVLPEEQGHEFVKRALEFIPAERLCVSTDSGFGREGVGRRHAFYKMVSLVQGTNIVRAELGAQEAYIPAADGRFAMTDDE